MAQTKIDLATQVQGILPVPNGGLIQRAAANMVLASPDGSPGPLTPREMIVGDLPNPIDAGTF